MAGQGLRLEADFTEDTVALALESFLAVATFPWLRFTIEPLSADAERRLGADARLLGQAVGFRPFYMQFKRPSAYPSTSRSRIIRGRLQANPEPLSVDPRVVFFSLRQKQPHHRDFQHNVLFRLRRRLLERGLGDAAYVCPLFLDRSAYRFHVHFAALAMLPRIWRHFPWGFEDMMIYQRPGSLRIESVPVFAEHICIPPHAQVADARHNYSFTEQGTEVYFHSPQEVSETPVHLDKWLQSLAAKKEPLVTPDSAREELERLLGDDDWDVPTDFRHGSSANRQDGVAAWLAWGDHLKRSHSIEQFAFVHWRL